MKQEEQLLEFPSPPEWKQQKALESYIKEASVSIVQQIYALATNEAVNDLTFRRDTTIFLKDFIEKFSKRAVEGGEE